MPASVNYSIVGESAPFTFSVKDMNGVEKFLYISNGKIYFTATQNGTYTVVVSKGDCHVSNQIIVNNCETVPTPSCTIPELSIVSIIDKIVTFNVTNTSGCNNLEFQSSTTSDFNSYISFNKSCQALNNIEFFQNGNYYLRVIKICTNGLQMISNIVSVAINQQVNNCYVSTACLGIGNDLDYDTYRITLKNVTNENVEFLLSNGSIITVYAGDIYGQEIINVTQNCPTVVSNSLNLLYCGIPTPVTPTPVSPTSNCLKVYAINNSSLTDIITFILCDGSEQSYTLTPYSASPEVCIINENSWTSNIGEITIYNRGTC